MLTRGKPDAAKALLAQASEYVKKGSYLEQLSKLSELRRQATGAERLRTG